MAERIGNSNTITREYLDSLLIETRYMNSKVPDLTYELYGKTFSTPIMTAALSHLHEAGIALAEGAKQAHAVLWYGMADDEEIKALSVTGASLVEIIKLYTNRDKIYHKIELAEKLGHLAVGIDIDHPFNEDGGLDVVDGEEMTPMTTEEFQAIAAATKLPVIAKGVLSVYDADELLNAGAQGIVVSHHNNRIEFAVPPLMALPEIAAAVKGAYPIFVDGDIKSGMDAFKALALGAKGICIGRPLIPAAKENGAEGVAEYIRKTGRELAKVMAYTGCTDLSGMDATVIHRNR